MNQSLKIYQAYYYNKKYFSLKKILGHKNSCIPDYLVRSHGCTIMFIAIPTIVIKSVLYAMLISYNNSAN